MTRGLDRAVQPQPQAAVVLARCGSTPVVFGIRMQHDGSAAWLATWAFAISAARATREGYTQTKLAGSFVLATQYPGCPGCGSVSFAQCFTCKALGCWSGVDRNWKCPTCGDVITLNSTISEMKAGSD